mmetsp:Transcript_4077/g.5638  ORF Transcript_4077/g.5638 Transcript_4077/m.5638 type:complete len:572 (+) Transcript_4077:13-1728(+)|eukprot:CAMPEP_0170078788 /NCGR_PEP_ID=MMETSP0019_2-20121128/15330_1 /TAXON_ID=98059 /ORGANISM="Dinobryon sp., Strain UTEXLB2267" /LENGTH=571 /DNA_ID=CAMNT_0010291917 /DNA_START=1 /DNA_END=1716 /DNA_ORIENTATION=-
MLTFFLAFVAAIAVTTINHYSLNVDATALDDYVWKADDNYGWTELDYVIKAKVVGRGYTAFALNLTSQRWLTDADFSPSSNSISLWWHTLMVIVPDSWVPSTNTNGILWITGGSVTDGLPQASDEDIQVSAALATGTGCITGALFQIPNEHTTFAADPLQKSRTEDGIIAFTWEHFLNDPSDPTWLLRFPMVKASLRAMDAVSEFVAQKYATDNAKVDKYIVSGASKRGWTTWDVAAVDPNRVIAIVPIVLDAINFVAVEHHQFRSYGGWTFALSDYTDLNITMRFDDANMLLLQQNVDPFFYKERLTMPKLVINAVLDEFQQPDDTRYWWSEMPEPKHFLIVPNAEHSMATGIQMIVPAVSAWCSNLIAGETIPAMTWTINESTGEIVATLGQRDSVVHEAKIWYGYSCGQNAWDGNKKRRDFRVANLDYPCSCGVYAEGTCANLKSVFHQQVVNVTTHAITGKRTISATLPAPADGRWVAFFIEVKFFTKLPAPFTSQQLAEEFAISTPSRNNSILPTKLREIINAEFGGSVFAHDFGKFFDFTTEVSVWPNTFPYEECFGETCGVRLL